MNSDWIPSFQAFRRPGFKCSWGLQYPPFNKVEGGAAGCNTFLFSWYSRTQNRCSDLVRQLWRSDSGLCIQGSDIFFERFLPVIDEISGSLKIWNIKTTQCIRTIESGYAICSTFLPGDRHVSSNLYSYYILNDEHQLDCRWNKIRGNPHLWHRLFHPHWNNPGPHCHSMVYTCAAGWWSHCHRKCWQGYKVLVNRK
jgi:hypothetical protein